MKTFKQTGSQYIDNLDLALHTYCHKATGAMHIHLASKNSENVFLVAFRTLPKDSTGVAHILEHTVLCGSKHYPVRDPFFAMIKRSLNSFMNAFTASDWTAYPFATTNKKDFNNLLQIYLDATFFPNLNKLDFMQEGHHLKFKADIKNKDKLQKENLEFGGIVFNEMKGAMSSANSQIWQLISKTLFLTQTYHYNSGGEPLEILNLTHKDLVSFHKEYYHPSNTIFYTFGDISAEQHQQKFEELVLRHFKTGNSKIRVADEQRFSSPKDIVLEYAIDNLQQEQDLSLSKKVVQNKDYLITAFLLPRSSDIKELLTAQLIETLLLDNSSMPMLEWLENNEFSNTPSRFNGLEESLHEMVFMFGLEAIDLGDKLKTQQKLHDFSHAIDNKLIEIINTKPNQRIIDNALHQLELSYRDLSGGGYPFGLSLILRLLPGALANNYSADLLDLEKALQILRQELKDKDFFSKTIYRWFLNNKHRVNLAIKASSKKNIEQQEQEKQKLIQIGSKLSKKDLFEVYSANKTLEARQAKIDNPNILPKVEICDIEKQIKSVEIISFTNNSQKVCSAHQDLSQYFLGLNYASTTTNGINYSQVNLYLNLFEFPPSALGLYTQLFSELGHRAEDTEHNDFDYKKVQQQKFATVAYIEASVKLYYDYSNNQQNTYKSAICFSSKYLETKSKPAIELLINSIKRVRFDEKERIGNLVSQYYVAFDNQAVSNGHALAMNYASAMLDSYAAWLDGLHGITYHLFIRDWHNKLKNRAEHFTKLQSNLTEIQNAMLKGKVSSLLVASENFITPKVLSDKPQIRNINLDNLLNTLEQNFSTCDKKNISTEFDNPNHAHTFDCSEYFPKLQLQNTAIIHPAANINFCSLAFKVNELCTTNSPLLKIIAIILRNAFLHTEIREKGGAYGAGATFDECSGTFRFFSYRDPNIDKTFTIFNKSLDFLLARKFTKEHIEQAILNYVSAIDKPLSPISEILRHYTWREQNRSYQQIKQERDLVLNLNKTKLQTVIDKIFHNYANLPQVKVVFSGGQQLQSLKKCGFKIIQL